VQQPLQEIDLSLLIHDGISSADARQTGEG
jgi:hypothetical protein